MKTISLKIDEQIFLEMENLLSRIKVPRNRYINEALSYYNRIQHRIIIKEKLKLESELVREDSMAVLKEFEKFDYAD